MARAIEIELADLQMARARFGVQITWTTDPNGAIVDGQVAQQTGEKGGRYAFDSHGLDSVVFLVSANPGEPLRPLAKIASGGETSRLMLALKTVLGRADETPTLIFDEIDQGIGGRVGGTVGRKLWGLTVEQKAEGKEAKGKLQIADSRAHRQPAESQSAQLPFGMGKDKEQLAHQVLCITHLPQLAVYGDVHFQVSKHVEGSRTVTAVHTLAGDERVAELAHMLGADSETGRASAAEMVAEVENVKRGA
jgi:DNA repair protein RecN (Recombination protein N)